MSAVHALDCHSSSGGPPPPPPRLRPIQHPSYAARFVGPQLSRFAPSMAHLNDHYLKLKAGYLFPEIARRVKVFCEQNPEAAKRLIRCGIGDVTEPLPAAVVAALHKAVDEMASRGSFKGYGPEQGYDFL